MRIHSKIKLLRSVSLLVCSLTMLLLISSCTLSGTTNETTAPVATTESRRYISESALIQQIALAIDNRTDIQSAFDAIPERQRQNISADQFQRYILLLRRGIAGQVVSFTPMTEQDLSEIRADIVDHLPAQADLVTRTTGYWLNFGDSGMVVDQLALYCQQHEDGYAYLDLSWIEQVLKIGEFFNLYFDAIDQRDTDALEELLRVTLPEPAARVAIARDLSGFYRFQVETETSEFRMLSMRIDQVSFNENLISAIASSSKLTRTIDFYQQPDGQIRVNDFLPSELDARDAELFLGETALFKVGLAQESGEVDPVYSVTLDKKIGEPVYHNDTNCSVQEDGFSLIRLNYEGLDLTVKGDCYNHDRWRGEIVSVTTYTPTLTLGSGLRAGDSLATLYAIYPFISVGDQVATLETPGGRIELSVTASGGVISSIHLEYLN